MTSLKRAAFAGLAAALCVIGVWAGSGSAAPYLREIMSMDLSKPFATRAPWRLTANQGAPLDPALTPAGADEPGEIQLCLQSGPSNACDPALQSRLGVSDDYFSTVHYLLKAQVVSRTPGHSLLLVRTASIHGGNGSQRVVTQLLVYRASADRFVRVYHHATGTNNNEEDRFIEAGLLKGDLISVEPTSDAPFVFWVSVNAPTPAGPYKQVLRYRSATHYRDGNPLAVIDSEMPAILQHLGLWRPGMPLPRPAGPCPKPHMVGKEMWCE